MFDFSKEIGKFHNDHVRLTHDQRADMKNRRETNLSRIEKGLESLGKPEIVETINQGGYAQKTMTQPPEADQESRYDIDLGVVFEEEDAAGPRTTRNWVRDAIAEQASNMKNEPESKKKCVRVIYADGYQCDFPVFRRSCVGGEWQYELSSGDDWDESDPKAMNAWVETEVSERSPETTGSYQLRRIIRFGKYFAKTHASRLNLKFPSGLVATALFINEYVPIEERDDYSFRETLRNISCRSEYEPVYANGVQVSDNKDIDRIRRLIEQAAAAVEELDELDDDDITASDACKAWKKVFRHSYFDEIIKEDTNSASADSEGSSHAENKTAIPLVASEVASKLSDEEKMRLLESAVDARRQSGEGSKPWSC